jgi:hypothetical protein
MIRLFELVMQILLFSYFVGLIYYVFCDFVNDKWGKEDDHAHDLKDFIHEKGIDELNAYDRTVAITYYAITTLSTVGFGDFHPVGDHDRVLMVIIFLVGNFLFSVILDTLCKLMREIT